MRTDLARWTLGTTLFAAFWFGSMLAVVTVGTAHGQAADRDIHVAGAHRAMFTVSDPVRATFDPSPS
ncbi:MAG TPA: hypothetical protein VEC57_18260 [Candidatus Limnocylindrales bacterium]|nr:hypothetical protein [Candidatus Limnocylindrales bacterium]